MQSSGRRRLAFITIAASVLVVIAISMGLYGTFLSGTATTSSMVNDGSDDNFSNERDNAGHDEDEEIGQVNIQGRINLTKTFFIDSERYESEPRFVSFEEMNSPFGASANITKDGNYTITVAGGKYYRIITFFEVGPFSGYCTEGPLRINDQPSFQHLDIMCNESEIHGK